MKKLHIIASLIIVFTLFLAFSTYRYFEIKEQRSKEPISYDLPSYGVGSKPRMDILRDHLVKKTIKQTSPVSWLEIIAGIIVINIRKPYARKTKNLPSIRNSSDSDRSQCSKPPLVTQKIRTRFAGYVLEYPCTVRSNGTIITYFDKQDNSYSDYVLYLGIVLHDDASIWKLKHDEDINQKPAFRVILTSNGREIHEPPLIKQRSQMTKVHDDFNGLTLYRDFDRIVGYLNDEKDASGHSPAISCRAASGTAVEDVFSLLESSSHIMGTSCFAAWALTKDIYITMPTSSIKSKYAYHFKDIFQRVNNGIEETIKNKPNNSTKTITMINSAYPPAKLQHNKIRLII